MIPLQLDTNVFVECHLYGHVMAKDRNVILKMNWVVMGVRKKNAVTGTAGAIANGQQNHQFIMS